MTRTTSLPVEALEARRLLAATFDVDFGVTGPGFTVLSMPADWTDEAGEIFGRDDLTVAEQGLSTRQYSVAYSEAGGFVASFSFDRSVRPADETRWVRVREDGVLRAALSPDGGPLDITGEARPAVYLPGKVTVPDDYPADAPRPDPLPDAARRQRELEAQQLIPLPDGSFLAHFIQNVLRDDSVSRLLRVLPDGTLDPDYELSFDVADTPVLLRAAVVLDAHTGVAAIEYDTQDGTTYPQQVRLVMFDPTEGTYDADSIFDPLAGVNADRVSSVGPIGIGPLGQIKSRMTSTTQLRLLSGPDGSVYLNTSLNLAPGLGDVRFETFPVRDFIESAVMRLRVEDGALVGDREFGAIYDPDQPAGLLYLTDPVPQAEEIPGTSDARIPDGRTPRRDQAWVEDIDSQGRLIVQSRVFPDRPRDSDKPRIDVERRSGETGTLDAAFGDNGRQPITFFSPEESGQVVFFGSVEKVLVRPDDSLVAVVGNLGDIVERFDDGFGTDYKAKLNAARMRYAVVALDPDGLYDADFDTMYGPGRSIARIDAAVHPDAGETFYMRSLVGTETPDGGYLLSGVGRGRESYADEKAGTKFPRAAAPAFAKLDFGGYGLIDEPADVGLAAPVVERGRGDLRRTARITGTSGNDQISLRLDGQAVQVLGGATGEVLIGTYGLADVDRFEVFGGDGDDVLTSELGDDFAGVVTLYGGAGNDTLQSGGRYDRLYGGDGDDRLEGGGLEQQLHGGAGDDTLVATRRAALFGGAGNDLLTGSDDGDLLVAGEGGDTLRSGAGNDTLSGDAGDDLDAGAGRDLLWLINAETGYAVDLSAGTFSTADASSSLLDIEDVIGSRFADTIVGDDDANLLIGGLGGDTLRGNGGDDTLLAGGLLDATLLDGGDGDDLLLGLANSSFIGGAGARDIAFRPGTSRSFGDSGVERRAITIDELLDLIA